MLQQILQDMYVDPELLAELSDEQKQLLFVKMREEQVRRWQEKEDKLEAEEKKKPKKPQKPGRKNVEFLKAKDGNVWVWVMGEHRNDLTIEQILEAEAIAKAEKVAEKELEELSKKAEFDIKQRLQEEQKKLEEEQKLKEEELKKKEEEAALYQSIKEAREAARKAEEEKRKSQEQEKTRIEQLRPSNGLHMNMNKFATEKRKSMERLQKDKNRRSSEIYIQMKEIRKQMEKVAEENSVEIEKNWKEQEKKAKEAQNQIEDLARKARIEYKNSMRASVNAMSVVNEFKKRVKPPIPPKNMEKMTSAVNKKTPRPPRPPNRQAVIDWFLEVERPRGSGISSATGEISKWFHGVISRPDAENILINQCMGSFLVRVSERVWGYTISFRAKDRCKHFLVDTSEDGYQFFGANQIQHKNLEDLVNFHKDNFITALGEEKLLYPVGQQKEPPDYEDLMKPRITQSTKI